MNRGKIISYASGGLGNRFRPLASCYALSKLLNKEISVYWPQTMRCHCKFENLFDFDNEIQILSDDEILELPDLLILSTPADISHEQGLNNINLLSKILNRNKLIAPISEVHLIPKHENIIIYGNNFFGGLEFIQNKMFFDKIRPKKELKDKIDKFILENNIDKNVIGVHARLTDFPVPFEMYSEPIDSIINNNPSQRIFICSDSKEFEQNLKLKYPNNILFYEKNNYPHKAIEGIDWRNNVLTMEESVSDAVIDLYVLSKTNLTIYNPHSTFAEITKFLQ